MRRELRHRLSIAALSITIATAAAHATPPSGSTDGVWTPLSPAELETRKSVDAKPGVRPEKYRAFELDSAALEPILARAVATEAAPTEAPILSLPMPDGGFERFSLVRSQTMHPDLERRMAELGWPIKTYRGESLSRRGVVAHLDWGGPEGFHAMVAAPGSTYYVDPYWRGDRRLYVSYAKRDLRASGERLACSVNERLEHRDLRHALTTTGGNLRTYRLAVAATGEYTAFHGGTQAGGQAAIITTVDRINLVYELETSIALSLVANNIDLVYTNAATDPYTNNNGSMMLGENQTTVDSVIGSANYDIGHVVSTGGGGVAGLGVVCDAARKARGVTGSPSPEMDAFDIDYVAHEVGHQFGANHPWNATDSSCSAANFSATTAYEVGSGSTIMAYAGICGADDLQAHSDDNFHGISLDEILAYTAGGGACSTNTSAGNPNEPTVDAGSSYQIPVRTPFELATTAGGDADGGAVTYSWEEFDRGTQSPLATGDDGVQPIFRAWPPVPDSTRIFPRLENLLQNTTPVGETLPTTTRTMTFRVTIRDNHAAGGRVGKDDMTVTTATNSGPFRVNFPNGGEQVSGMQTITWSVANTTAAPVSTANVDILLSINGGRTFPFVLKSATPNDGTEAVDLTGRDSATARIKIKGTGNIFFDLSDADFTIGNPQPHLLIVLDRTGSMLATRASTGMTRCHDALELAKQDLHSFFTHFAAIPGISAAVWTFAGSAPTDLTGGFVSESAARAALDTLTPEGCAGSTPLADTLCAGSDFLNTAFPGVGPGDRILAISSDGGENNSSGACAGPDSSSGPPYDQGSWQAKVRVHLTGQNVVLARFWGSVVNRSVDIETGRAVSIRAVSDFDFFRDLAMVTGGIYSAVGDDEPLPEPIFGPGPSVTAIPTLSELGLVVLIAALCGAAMFYLRRRRRLI